MSGFCLASDLGPSLSEREMYEATIRAQAEALQEARGKQSNGGMKPEEKQALIQLLSDIRRENEDLKKQTEKQAMQIETLQDSLLRLIERVNTLQEGLNSDIAMDRRRIKKLEGEEDQQPKQKDRSDMLRLLLASQGGKMLAKDARHKLGISESQLSQLLKSMPGLVEVRPLHTDRRQHVIALTKALTNDPV